MPNDLVITPSSYLLAVLMVISTPDGAQFTFHCPPSPSNHDFEAAPGIYEALARATADDYVDDLLESDNCLHHGEDEDEDENTQNFPNKQSDYLLDDYGATISNIQNLNNAENYTTNNNLVNHINSNGKFDYSKKNLHSEDKLSDKSPYLNSKDKLISHLHKHHNLKSTTSSLASLEMSQGSTKSHSSSTSLNKNLPNISHHLRKNQLNSQLKSLDLSNENDQDKNLFLSTDIIGNDNDKNKILPTTTNNFVTTSHSEPSDVLLQTSVDKPENIILKSGEKNSTPALNNDLNHNDKKVNTLTSEKKKVDNEEKHHTKRRMKITEDWDDENYDRHKSDSFYKPHYEDYKEFDEEEKNRTTIEHNVLGFKPSFLAETLSPPKQMCNSMFELTVDDLVFLGHPVHIRDNGLWRQNRKSSSKRTTTIPTLDLNLAKSESITNRSRSNSYEKHNVSDGNEDIESEDDKDNDEEDLHEYEYEYEKEIVENEEKMDNYDEDYGESDDNEQENYESGSDNEGVYSKKTSDTGSNKSIKSKKKKNSKGKYLNKSKMTMFHIVFVSNPPDLEYKQRIRELYVYVARRLAIILRYEQAKSNYVWEQSKILMRIRDEFMWKREANAYRNRRKEKKQSFHLSSQVRSRSASTSSKMTAKKNRPKSSSISSIHNCDTSSGLNNNLNNSDSSHENHYEANSNNDYKSSNTKNANDTNNKHNNNYEESNTFDNLANDYEDEDVNDDFSNEAMWKEMIKSSPLALALSQIYSDIASSSIASVNINGEMRSFQIPIQKQFTSLPPVLGISIAGMHLSSVYPQDVASGNNLKPLDGGVASAENAIHFALLLLDDPEQIIKDINPERDSPASMIIRAITPTDSLVRLANKTGLEVEDIKRFAEHLIYWRRARFISPILARNTYIVSPTAPLGEIYSHMQIFRDQFPLLPTLPTFLFLLSRSKPTPFARLIPTRDHRDQYLAALAWLIRFGYVTQLFTYAWMHISREIKIAVSRDEKFALRETEEALKKTETDFNDSLAAVSGNDTNPSLNTNLNKFMNNKFTSSISKNNSLSTVSFNDEKDISLSVSSSLTTTDCHDEELSRNNSESKYSLKESETQISSSSPDTWASSYLKSTEMKDYATDSILLEPDRATILQRKWLSKILLDKPSEITELFNRVMKYFNGRTPLESVPKIENVSRHDLRKLINSLDDHIIIYKHW